MAMKEIRIEKIVCNIGCGTHTPVENAKKILERLTEKTPVIIKTAKRNTFGVPKNKPIGCKITIRHDAAKFAKRMLEANENRIKTSSFDDKGNFAFGIKEYIDVPGMDYDPKIGVIGMDVCVTLERPGYAVKKKRHPHKLGKKHVITKDEAVQFVKEKFNVKVE
ncbi:MAG: 50S ribosomal protein L5 [Candidatus Aenigmarchaeota archaeon]|nr:50S ribosomal protein L5 [Candidatus Aenigmarchaeota archaeon]